MPRLSGSIRQEEDDEDEEYYGIRKGKKKVNPPRFIKNAIDNVDPDEIVVNLSKTHYDVIELVVEELGWIAERSKKSEKWDIMWTDWHIQAQDLFKLNDQQKISHFPAIYVLARKNFLGRSLMKMNKTFPEQYNYFPFTWSVPSEIAELMRFDAQYTQQQKPVYIFKPQASSQGKGISLFTKTEQLEGKTGVVQVYVNNPLLIDNLKFDMRIYVLIYGCDPLRIYIYEQGLARFATQNYQKAKKKNLKDNFIHLTNYAINKTNKKFIFNTSQHNMNVGHKRSLSAVFNLMNKRGYDVASIKQKIDKMVVKTLLVGKPMLEHMYGLSQTDNLANDHCFQILGFDVLINDKVQPILLQVNHTPSFATDTPLDKSIKKQLIKETLLLLNVNIQTKKIKIAKKMDFEEKRAQRRIIKLTPEEKIEQKKLIEQQKNEYEAATLKRFRRLYPTDSHEFDRMEDYAFKVFNQQSGFKNKEISKSGPHIRPVSLENMPITNKIKKSGAQFGSNNYSPVKLQRLLLDKLPEIFPKKPNFLKSPITNSKMVLKNYQFSPDKAFANLTEKYAQKLKHSQNIIDNTPIIKKDGSGSYLQPNFIKIKEFPYKSQLDTQNLSGSHQNPQKSQPRGRKTFLDFVSLSNREKGWNARAKKEEKMKMKVEQFKSGLLEEFLQEQVFTMKSFSFTRREDKQ